MVVEDDLRITDPKCAQATKDAFVQMQKLALTAEGRNSLNNHFKYVN